MNEAGLIEEINSELGVSSKLQRNKRIWIKIKRERLTELCRFLYEQNFKHLSAISATDYIEEEVYELTYHIWSYWDKILITVKTEISRDKPEIESLTEIWDGSAQIHERELHELFGVNFIGNPDLSQLFLEDWDGPPPFRKDFDWREYVRKEYYDEENEREKPYFV